MFIVTSCYRTGRQQYVNFQSTDSDKMFIKGGVTQGSNLGTLLILVFINELHTVSSAFSSCILFADDSNFIISGTDFKQILKTMNGELEKITGWLKSNNSCLNVHESNFMVFATKNKKKSWTKNLKLE